MGPGEDVMSFTGLVLVFFSVHFSHVIEKNYFQKFCKEKEKKKSDNNITTIINSFSFFSHFNTCSCKDLSLRHIPGCLISPCEELL